MPLGSGLILEGWFPIFLATSEVKQQTERNMATLDNKALNYVNVLRNSYGRRRIFIHMTSNPQMITLNSDLTGDAVMARIMWTKVATAAPQPFYQLDFSSGVHNQQNIAAGARASCFQIIGDGSREKVPLRFNSDHLPQNFKLTILNPGEPATVTALGADGAQVCIEFDYIAT